MIKLFFIPVITMLSCGSAKSNQAMAKTDSVIATKPGGKMYQQDTGNITVIKDAPLPACIKNKIDSFKMKEAHERPQRVLEYTYKGKKVYYVVLPCCDFFNEVYDDKCNFLGAPDGGFTGKGDGKIPDFFEEAKGEKLVWGTPK